MTAPRPGKPDICDFCAAKLVRRPHGEYYIHRAQGCILTGFSFADTPENIQLWNRRVGKPLWAPERPWEDPDYLATHPRKE